MLITVNTSLIPPETFKISARKNATTKAGRKCPVPDPQWLTDLIATGCELQMQDLVVEVGQTFCGMESIATSLARPQLEGRLRQQLHGPLYPWPFPLF